MAGYPAIFCFPFISRAPCSYRLSWPCPPWAPFLFPLSCLFHRARLRAGSGAPEGRAPPAGKQVGLAEVWTAAEAQVPEGQVPEGRVQARVPGRSPGALLPEEPIPEALEPATGKRVALEAAEAQVPEELARMAWAPVGA